MKYIRVIISVIIVITFAYIIVGEFVFPENVPEMGYECDTLPSDNWYIVHEDGTKEKFDVPGRVDSDIVLETTLPEGIGTDINALCFRGMDMSIYIDGKLRKVYTVEDYPVLGDRSAECFVMMSIYPEDAGKILTIDYSYNWGFVYQVYIGNRIGILFNLIKSYGLEIVVAFATLILGVICYLAAIGYQIIHKRYLELRDLSLGVIIGGVWVISNSILRQVLTLNISIMSDMPFLMVLIMPFPFLIFINSLQSGRHKKAIMFASIVQMISFVSIITLFITGTMNLMDSFVYNAASAVVCIAVISYTMVDDVIKHKAASYKYVLVGFIFLGVAALCQILMFLFAHNGVFSGLFMSVGLLGFIILSMIHTIKQIIDVRIVANDVLKASKIKDEFLANMSHEIRTPLNGILGMNEMILRDTKESRIRKYAVNIKGAGNTLLSLINDILDMSKIEAGSLELIYQEYDISSVLNDVINMTRNKALDKDLEYKFEVSETIPSFLIGDEIRVRQVMLNIINNAVKYTEEGYVHIKVDALDSDDTDKTTLCLEVVDSGIGIKEEDMDKLFKSFQRLDEKKNQKVEGTGLGLNITDRLVNMMNGHIDVKSEYGKGSAFTVYMPQLIANNEPIGDFSDAVTKFVENMELSETTLYIPDVTMLIVDDNDMNLEVMEGLLRETKAKLTLVTSGRECIDMVRDNKYDIIMLDQMMPEMSGTDTLKHLIDEDILNDTPVIALTADAIVGAKEHYISMGFTDYLSKPVQYEKLEDLLREYIDDKKQLIKKKDDDNLPVMLLWGTDSKRLRDEKTRLEGIYKCVCVVGTNAKDKYLSKHNPDGVMQVY